MLNIVTSYPILLEFKKSQYFKVNLGLVATVEKNGSRKYNADDSFSYFYNNQYRTTIYGQGNVGNIKFYVDHFVKDTTFAVYSSIIENNVEVFEEFLFQFDFKIAREKGIDFYLGHILKRVDEQYQERVLNEELKKMAPKPLGNAENVLSNPGNVNYEDLKAYLAQKNKSRYT